MKLLLVCIFKIVLLVSPESPSDSLSTQKSLTTTKTNEPSLAKQQDMVDIFHHVFPKFKTKERDTLALEKGKKFFWTVPAVGYSPQTSFLVQLYGNLAFKNQNSNISTVISYISFTANKQVLFNSMPNIWTKKKRYNWIGDYRIMQYPQDTYGLGIRSTTTKDVQMDYAYLRIYQYVLKNFGNNFYGGLGFNFDYHWNIVSTYNEQTLSSISRYTYGTSGSSHSSGPSINLLFDNRLNSINPQQGVYANLIARANRKVFGSDNNYFSILLDARTYMHFPRRSSNILAFWSYNVITTNRDAPFLDLPSTGWDTYSNMGRGYIQGRFRGHNLFYAETEYRFGITRNRLLGGVVFVNAQTVNTVLTRITEIKPATGLGLRLKLNKFSRTHLAADYGFGADGSSGLFFNVGEVF